MLLMFAPLRSVMAMQQIHCDMGNHIAGMNADQNAESSTVVSGYSDDHDMLAMSMVTSTSDQKKSENSHGCCSGKSICTSNCDMSISASLLIQESSYIPNFTNIPGPVTQITDLIKKEFTPPFRPPLVFHS